MFKDTIRAMQERIKQLEDEVRQLKSTPAPSPVAAAPSGLEDRITKLEEGWGLLSHLKFGGMIYSSYNYNFNNPDSRNNDLRIFDTKANNFTFDFAQLSVAKEEEGGVGFKLLLDYGRTARGITSDWNGEGDLSNGTDNFEVQEAYITYTAGIGKGLGIKAGKFVTLLGAEVIESPSNYNISRSFLFGYAIPFTHTGILLSYPILDTVSLTAGVVNGWDNVIDSNKGKTFLGGLSLQPFDGLTWTFNGTYGAEQPNIGGSKRGVFDTVLTYNFNDNVTLAANYDRGSESGIGLNGGSAIWQGIAGYLSIGGALFNPNWEPFSLSQRVEWFSDEDGVRTGTVQDLWEVTTTLKWKLTENLHARFEYRHDESSKKAFSQSIYRRNGESFTRFLSGQDTIAAELAYLFY
ncbi:MAG: porin [Candidatus Binatia bacterium]